MSNIYPTTITAPEAADGFQLIRIESEYSTILGTPEMWDVAAKRLSEGDFLFKVDEGYKHMRYGYRASDKAKRCALFPMGDQIYDSPAIQTGELVAQRGKFAHIIEVEFKT